MKEQSHKDEMSKALRGDFERLRDRGVATTLAAGHESRPDEAVAAKPEIEPEAAPGHEPESLTQRREPEPEHEAEPTPEPALDVPVAEPDEPRGSWLDRLLGR